MKPRNIFVLLFSRNDWRARLGDHWDIGGVIISLPELITKEALSIEAKTRQQALIFLDQELESREINDIRLVFPKRKRPSK